MINAERNSSIKAKKFISGLTNDYKINEIKLLQLTQLDNYMYLI